jgi:hypothetical protein
MNSNSFRALRAPTETMEVSDAPVDTVATEISGPTSADDYIADLCRELADIARSAARTELATLLDLAVMEARRGRWL